MILDERHDVLYVPTSVVLEDSSVYLIPAGGGTLEKRQVGTGLVNWEQTEIVSGLVEGDYLVRSVDREGVENGAAAQIDEP